ncbi:thioesterase domain-containing protein [Phycisphaera mikurensis]|uniref:Uncharacterized protein n=1 Tax=Phycisphaera mikurensis (strain NBRC 102666 / KCTC 22515 / FYK2301M01) TaxID=1142394 RepID=I0IGC3_PHYMF|nr:hypothetical protein [Phycisphaera mikurensis]MBB6440310.1 hypothetical protein [Phycisphaera mikurensis]BAM04311.1 hypothetical protein PSMK_21520 [Phycisphaera mikurensis NBRC 102666]
MSDIRLDIDGSARHLANRRRNARALLLAAALLAAALFALPRVASSGWGNAWVLRQLNARILGTVAVESAEIGWLGGARVDGLVLRDPEGIPVVTGLEAEAASLGLLDLATGWATGRWPEADLSIRVADVRLQRSEAGRLNLARSLAAPPRPRGTGKAAASADAGPPPAGWRERVGWTGSGVARPPAVRVRLDVARGLWTPAPGAEATGFEAVEAGLDLRDADRLALELSGRTVRLGTTGRLRADLVLLNGRQPGGGIGWREAALEARAEASALPVALLGELTGSGGWAAAALGPTLGGRLAAEGTLALPEATLEVDAERLRGRLRLVRDGGDVRAAEGGELAWTLTPEAFAAIAPPAEASAGGWSLESAVTLRLGVDRLRLSEGAAGAQPEWASFRLAGDLEDAVLRGDGHRIGLLGGRLSLESRSLGRKTDLVIAGTADAGGSAGPQPARVRVSLLNARMPAGAGPPTLQVEALGLPTPLLGLLGPAGARSAETLGPTLGLSVEAVQTLPADRLRRRPEVVDLKIDVASRGMTGPVRLRLLEAGRAGSLSTPEPLRLRLEPAAVASLLPQIAAAGVTVERAVSAELDLRELRWSAPPGALPRAAGLSRRELFDAWLRNLDPARSGMMLGLQVPRVRLRGPGGGLVDLADLTLEADAHRLGGQPRLFADTRVVPADGGTTVLEPGSVRVEGSILGLVDDRQRVRPAGAEYLLEVVGDALPAATLDRVLGFGDRLPLLLGPVLAPSLVLDASPDHPLRVQAGFVSEHALVGLNAERRDDAFVLGGDGRLQLAISPAGADAVRGRLHPLTLDLVRGVPGEPLVLLPAAGARLRPDAGWAGWLPLIDGASVAAGGLEVRSDGWLLGGVERAVRQVAAGEGTLRGGSTVLRASPLTLSLDGGQLRHGPLWLSGEGLGLGLRGVAQAGPVREGLPAVEASAIQMRLALPAASVLRLAPEAARGVRPIDLYELPVGGWIGNPSVQGERFATDLLLSVGDAGGARGAIMSRWLGSLSAWDPPPAVRLLIAEAAEAERPAPGNHSDASSARSSD